MTEKKYRMIDIVTVVFCSLGCVMMVLPKFIETEYDLFSIALGLNGIGIVAFLIGRRS